MMIEFLYQNRQKQLIRCVKYMEQILNFSKKNIFFSILILAQLGFACGTYGKAKRIPLQGLDGYYMKVYKYYNNLNTFQSSEEIKKEGLVLPIAIKVYNIKYDYKEGINIGELESSLVAVNGDAAKSKAGHNSDCMGTDRPLVFKLKTIENMNDGEYIEVDMKLYDTKIVLETNNTKHYFTLQHKVYLTKKDLLNAPELFSLND